MLLRHFFLLLWLIFLNQPLLSGQVYAEQTEQSIVSIEQLQTELAQIPSSSKDNTDLQVQTAKISKIQQNAQLLLASLTQQVADLDNKISSISPVDSPGKGEASSASPASAEPEINKDAAPETVLIAEQRNALQKERNRLDALRKQTILLISDAEDKSNALVAERRQRFQEELSLQVRSIFSPTFWTNWATSFNSDKVRIQRFAKEAAAMVSTAMSSTNQIPFLFSTGVAILLLLFAHKGLKKLLYYFLISMVPTGRARRSFLAIGTVLNRVFTVFIAMLIFYIGLNWNGILDPDFDEYLAGLSHGVLLAAFVYGLGEAILCNDQKSWRLPHLSNEDVQNLKNFPALLSLLVLVQQFILKTGEYAGISFVSEVNSKTCLYLILSGLAIVFFARLFRRRTNAQEKDYSRPIWLNSLYVLAWLIALISAILALIGYVSLGGFLIYQLTWSMLIFSSFYILWKLADDVFQAFLSQQGHIGKYLVEEYAFNQNLLKQIIIILSAISKILLIYLLVKILLVPFGTNITQLLQSSEYLNSLLNNNTFTLTSGGVIGAILVCIIGFWLIKLFKSWLNKQYFPNTSIDRGVQSSISTMAGYLGGVAVIAITLGTLGLSFDKITWVASALSVGIGFGLQSIVQNFISGLILLTERPVKVGDWVIIGSDNGDIKRINIRATEIQLADRSTLIVPNSEFVTKAVRNMTLNKSEGRVLINIPLPISVNPRIVSDIILAVFNEHEQVLKEIAPFIRLDSVQNGNLLLSATCYVQSPRMVSQVRTDLLFKILDCLEKANIPLTTPTSVSQSVVDAVAANSKDEESILTPKT